MKPNYLICVIDDLRTFKTDPAREGEGDHIAVSYNRTSAWGFDSLKRTREGLSPAPRLAELWLDHDLGGDDDIRKIVLWLEELAVNGDPYPVDFIFIHTGNPYSKDWMYAALSPHYNVAKVEANDFFDTDWDLFT